jgi:hypothetical protein
MSYQFAASYHFDKINLEQQRSFKADTLQTQLYEPQKTTPDFGFSFMTLFS